MTQTLLPETPQFNGNIQLAETAAEAWSNPTLRLGKYALEELTDQTRPFTAHLSPLEPYEKLRHFCAPLYGNGSAVNPLVLVGRAVQGFVYAHPKHGYVDPDKLQLDPAGRLTLTPVEDKTQLDAAGIAWMTAVPENLPDEDVQEEDSQGEEKVMGIMYELMPRISFDPHRRRESGWRTLPVATELRPHDPARTPLNREAISKLDELEAKGVDIHEFSGLSARPDVRVRGASVFHEIMRRMVHNALIEQVRTGRETIWLFTIVEKTRGDLSRRTGMENFEELGVPIPPPGENVDKQINLWPCIIRASEFFSRQLLSYNKALASGRPVKQLEEGILFYTDGLDPDILQQYRDFPALIEKLRNRK